MNYLKIFFAGFLALYINISYGQNRWIRAYYENKDAVGNNFINSYDKGFILVGKHGSNYVHYNWLIKTDINGNVLWEKTIGDPSTSIMISDMEYDNSGNLYLVGLTGYYGTGYYDPLILKLDSCGCKEWCRVFIVDDINFAIDVKVLNDGSCLVLLRYMSPDGQTDRNCLANFSTDGELIWKECYNSDDPNIRNEDMYEILLTNDGYLLTGSCDYIEPNPPHLMYLKPYYIKTDFAGNFAWETVIFKESNEMGGGAFSTVFDPDSNYFYSSIRRKYYDPFEYCPALLKMDLQGNVVDIYDVVNGYENGKLSYATFINDTTLAASCGWGNSPNVWSRAVLVDTLGNLLKSRVLMEDHYTSIQRVTFDGKLAYFTNTYQNGQFDAYLTKLTQDLEDDSLYTYPFIYDSLCPYQIVSDTIVQDGCGLIVGDVELPTPRKEFEALEIYPNPATNQIKCKFQNAECNMHIWIYDMLGMMVDVVEVQTGRREVSVDVSGYASGVYLVVLQTEGYIVGQAKLVKH